MRAQFVKNRYYILFSFIILFVFSSLLIRLILFMMTVPKTDLGLVGVLRVFLVGLCYDVAVVLFLTAAYNLYLLFLPNRWSGGIVNKIITYVGLFIAILISFFSFFAEITFWQEFESRFNFIAVDYLIYTYEVINNINESYPLPLLITAVMLLTLLVMWGFGKLKVFQISFQSTMRFKQRLWVSVSLVLFTVAYPILLSNADAESSTNRYQNELSKAGIYSFFFAFKNNELNYNDFYSLMPGNKAFELIRAKLQEQQSAFVRSGTSIKRIIKNEGKAYKPNVIMITVESLSANFMSYFGNTQHLMPVLDSLANQSLFFTNMYATGTRTVRGMEALTLSIPPTPGSSIVRRPHNQNLSTVGHIFQQEGYNCTFFYGGDGYFDNMNAYFGNNGFNLVDRGRNLKIGDNYPTKRSVIPNSRVHFENAWGISDSDLLDEVIIHAEKYHQARKPFYDFVMTTSNHRPFTFPSGKIDMQPGSREAAVKYTDFAIGEFLKKISDKPWYKNTVIIIVADHCASSAGKNEIDISKYHIPCMVLNLPDTGKQVIDKLCSQIDLYPTLFSLLGWTYESNLYGQNVLGDSFEPRALLGTYQKLAYLKSDSLVVLGPQQKVESYIYLKSTNTQKPDKLSPSVIDEAKANYQTAYDLFKNGGLRQ